MIEKEVDETRKSRKKINEIDEVRNNRSECYYRQRLECKVVERRVKKERVVEYENGLKDNFPDLWYDIVQIYILQVQVPAVVVPEEKT